MDGGLRGCHHCGSASPFFSLRCHLLPRCHHHRSYLRCCFLALCCLRSSPSSFCRSCGSLLSFCSFCLLLLCGLGLLLLCGLGLLLLLRFSSCRRSCCPLPLLCLGGGGSLGGLLGELYGRGRGRRGEGRGGGRQGGRRGRGSQREGRGRGGWPERLSLGGSPLSHLRRRHLGRLLALLLLLQLALPLGHGGAAAAAGNSGGRGCCCCGAKLSRSATRAIAASAAWNCRPARLLPPLGGRR